MIEDGISIVEEIRKSRFEASVVATFNAYFPFYEDVVLRHLKNSGSRQNLVLIDARVCGGILTIESLRPRLAGREYTLLPIKVRTSFHPKIVLLLARKKGRLLIGSHNLTLAGFSHNRELTSRFELDDLEDLETQRIFRHAWNFIKAWANETGQPLEEILSGIETVAPWLQNDEPGGDVPLVSALPGGRSLWEQARAQLPKSPKRIIVTGPFFDTDLKFLTQLRSEYPRAEFTIGIDPDSVVINKQARKMVPFARFVNTNILRDGKGYFHAKAILFEEPDGSETLLCGSANPSEPAWMAKEGNAEIVSLHRSKKKNSIGRQLGLQQLARSVPLAEECWNEIARRTMTLQTAVSKGHAPLVAFVTDVGIAVQLGSLKEPILPEVVLLDSSDVAYETAMGDSSVPGLLQLILPQIEVRARAALLEIKTEGGKKILAIVHHPEELRELARTDRQRAMKDAINSLNTDTPMIEELMRVVEKVIFDDDLVISTTGYSGRETKAKNEKEKVQTKFSIPLKETGRRGSAASRILSQGDLAVLLDALIHQLGIGLNAAVYSAPAMARSEEELVGSDDDEVQLIKELDKPALVALCQRKVRTILRRMIRQLENVVGFEGRSVKALVQTAGVLGLVHRLCQVTSDEAAWVSRGETLVPDDARYNFFIDAARLLYRRKGLMKEIATKPDIALCAEASMVRGLLVWLAWDCDFQVANPVAFDDPEEVEANLDGLARLVAMVPDLVNDPEAFLKATQAIESSVHEYDAVDYDSNWLNDFKKWCDEIGRLGKNLPKLSVVSREAAPGDIAYPSKATEQELFVVAEASQRRVRLIDLDCEPERKSFASSYVTVVKAGAVF